MKIIFIMYVSNASLNLEQHMTIPFNISGKFEIMGNEKLSKLFSSPNFNSFLDTNAGKIPLVSMGGRAEGQACAHP